MHFSSYQFFTIINSALKENIWQEEQAGESLTKQDGGWGERSRSQLACADLVGRKVGDKYFGKSLLPPYNLMPGLPLARKGDVVQSSPGWAETMPSAPAILNGESSLRLVSYYEGFHPPGKIEGTGERPLSAPVQTTREPTCSEARELSPFLESRLMPTFWVGCYF